MYSFFSHLLIFISIVITFSLNIQQIKANNNKDSKDFNLLVTTVATHITDGFVRFNRSVNTYGLKLEVLGLNQKWLGGDVANSPGGGHKVNLLKDFMRSHKRDENMIILFVDSFDVILTANSDEIVKRFLEMNAKIVFSSEGFCWPNKSLATEYPKTEGNGKPYLNSGGFMGFAPQIHQMVSTSDINDLEDDQLFYTKIYIDQKLRNKLDIKLDEKSNLFQNLNGAVGDVEIRFSDDDSYVQNTAYQTNPLVIHGNGVSKVALNSLGNYLSKSWHPKDGCSSCDENKISLEKTPESQLPLILIGLYVTHKTPFFIEYLENIERLDYPKKKIHLFVFNSQSYHSKDMQNFIDMFKDQYRGINEVSSDKQEWEARNAGLDECVKVNCDYYLSVDCDVRLTNRQTLRALIEQNKAIIAPLLVRPKQLWSNFWGALSAEGFYSRSHDYVQIVKSERRGVWNVPFVSEAYLMNGSVLKGMDSNEVEGRFTPVFRSDLDSDMTFCKSLRENGMFMFVNNLQHFGHLVISETFDTNRINPDFYEIYSNQKDWEERYIHENYTQMLTQAQQLEQPCPDVYWFPVVSTLFCKHMIEILESFGQWSDGTNKDPRLSGGYENVPTRDIHMNQIGFEQHWLYFLREYIRPVQEKIFTGYFHDPPKAIMNFAVRYNPKEQPSLRPHHDASTYTINIALNTPHIDYEGGGCRFVRYNCSITNPRIGWSFIHPGRLTHYHEGLPVTKGTRYIMVSFVDP